MPLTSLAEPRRIIVLDTNVVLDWLVFGDERTVRMASDVSAGLLDWIVCPSMREELSRALAYPAVHRRLKASVGAVLSRFDALSRSTTEPGLSGKQRLICQDRDDQVFVDLALQHEATWLLSYDKMVLSLARRAAPAGLRIISPAGFGADVGAQARQLAAGAPVMIPP